MIAGFAKVFSFKPEFSFAQIGESSPTTNILPCGSFLLWQVLLPVVIFLLALQLKFRPQAAFITGLLVALENALIVQTRYILMDGFLLLFGFSALLFYFRRKFLWMAVFGGLAMSIKWTGLTFLALPLIIETWRYFINRSYEPFIKNVLIFILVPFAIYFSIFTLHFALLTKPGPGDAFMSQNFHNENVSKKFVELNVQMYQSNQRLTATHPYGSQWYSWPFMTRPIFYWVDSTSSPQVSSRIYLLGNPVIWWMSTVAVLLSLMYIVRHRIIKILLGGYF